MGRIRYVYFFSYYIHVQKFANFLMLLFIGQLGNAPSVVTDTLPTVEGATAAKEGPSAANEEEDEDLMGRLEALRS